MSYKGEDLVGQAYFDEICKSLNHGIIQYYKFYETVKIAAHEIGHSWVLLIFIFNLLLQSFLEGMNLHVLYFNNYHYNETAATPLFLRSFSWKIESNKSK